MVIKRSSGHEITDLVGALSATDRLQREAAVARLAIIGRRAVDPILAVLSAGGPAYLTAAALQALEGIGDPRALPAAARWVDDRDPAIAVAALAIARAHLRSSRASVAAGALDVVTRVALDPGRPDAARLAALDALLDLPLRTVAPVLRRLGDDRSAAVRQRALESVARRQKRPTDAGARSSGPDTHPMSAVASSPQAPDGELPEDPDAARVFIADRGRRAALGVLHRQVEQARDRELAQKDEARRAEWRSVRAALHQALAARGSRVALYDLRDSFAEAHAPLPVGFLAAASAVGDADCAEAVASAYARAPTGGHDWWRQHLAIAFREIVRRERLTRRHATLRRIAHRFPGLLEELLR